MAIYMNVSGTQVLRNQGRHQEALEVTEDKMFLQVTSNGVTLYYDHTAFDPDTANVFVVLKDADFTEGRGPMKYHNVFKYFDDAVAYVLKQRGIFGTEQYVDTKAGVNIHGRPYVYTTFNGYEILPTTLL